MKNIIQSFGVGVICSVTMKNVKLIDMKPVVL